MTNTIESLRIRHSAVRLDNHVVIFGGFCAGLQLSSTRVICSYNLYTEEWRKFVIPDTMNAPEEFISAVADTIDGVIYTFGGRHTGSRYEFERNALWTLERTKKGGFAWSYIKPQCKEQSPSPRTGHTGWEYEGKLWIFGGSGTSPEGYLNYNGDFQYSIRRLFRNNQLLCYDPNTQKWTNPQCFGDVPSPRGGHASAFAKNKVWLFGGYDGIQHMYLNDMFELTMHSLIWTQIHVCCPPRRHLGTLTAVTEGQLVLHGGVCRRDTWIMDTQSHLWKLCTSQKDDIRWFHTGSSGLNGSAIILGGFRYSTSDKGYNVFHVSLEPKLLQQLAMQIIYKHQAELPVEFLPVKLMSLLEISVKRRDDDS